MLIMKVSVLSFELNNTNLVYLLLNCMQVLTLF